TNLDGTGMLWAAAPNENTAITTSEVHKSDDDGNTVNRTVERTTTNVTVSDDEDTDSDEAADREVKIQMAMPAFSIDGEMSDEEVREFKHKFNINDSTIEAFASNGPAGNTAKILIRKGGQDIKV